jgi:putative membrane protein
MTKSLCRAAVVAALAAPLVAYGSPPEEPAAAKGELTPGDLISLAHFHHVNQMEIGMGNMAQARGTARVKSYGKMLVRDHTRLDRGLVRFAKQRKITIPADRPRDDAEAAAMKAAMEKMSQLESLAGEAFDREFLALMVSDHQTELARLDTAIANATDARLRGVLKQAQPLLEKHFTQAKKLLPDMANEATASAPPPPTSNKGK